MFRLLPLLALSLASCSAHGPPGLPYDNMHHDQGTLTGSWTQVSGNVPAQRRQLLTIDLAIGTFAVASGCLGTGGTLMALGDARYRIARYESGFANAGCPPWRPDPALAPFNGDIVRLVRQGDRLQASNPTASVTYRRLVLR